ncbi:F-box protein At2g32560-like isoform X2 [Macadamia integrifolia]|uniref:F-box protein At2g32560-like isoform X2 n=1 Tax=Macadamia integrifolia TaxID=60698 RepID=UPI001C4E7190|nr:F-box protein At2g32560-like isoform X2 [Macadamia integrifolia]
MLFFLISCLSFVLLSKSLPLKPLPPWENEMRLLSLWFWKEFSCFLVSWLRKSWLSGFFFEILSAMSMKKKNFSAKVENVEESEESSVLDLPELALECILAKLPPEGLCNVAGVCSSLRDRCRSDYLWERHMKEKWGRVIGRAAYREWQCHIASRKDSGVSERCGRRRRLVRSLSCAWPFSWIKSKVESNHKQRSSLPANSLMSWYLSLDSGKFWFPGQVYNRENGHVGFMMSCYDAELCYDSSTDTFHARFPPHGRRTIVIEDGVQWHRLRTPPVDTPPHDLHVSDCLYDLRPGDHIEIQWRRNKEFPYGWWYGVVGHSETCSRNENHCNCYSSDTVVLEFNQYTPGSRWRRTSINRKVHREEGNEADGFYGGIRKLYKKEEVSMWKQLWPTEVLE